MKKGCVKCILLAVLICFLILSPKISLKAASVKITKMSAYLSSIDVVAKKKITNKNQSYDLKVTKGKKTVTETSMTKKQPFLA